MAWIVGRKSDKKIVEVNGRVPSIPKAALETNIVKVNGGVAGDFSYYEMTAQEFEKIMLKHDNAPAWTGDEITGVDFTAEETKRWIRFTLDKNEILGDGVDAASMTIEVLKADQSGVETKDNGTYNVPIRTPVGEVYAQVTFAAGVKSVSFKTTEKGLWIFPSRAKAGAFNNAAPVKLNVIDTGILD